MSEFVLWFLAKEGTIGDATFTDVSASTYMGRNYRIVNADIDGTEYTIVESESAREGVDEHVVNVYYEGRAVLTLPTVSVHSLVSLLQHYHRHVRPKPEPEPQTKPRRYADEMEEVVNRCDIDHHWFFITDQARAVANAVEDKLMVSEEFKGLADELSKYLFHSSTDDDNLPVLMDEIRHLEVGDPTPVVQRYEAILTKVIEKLSIDMPALMNKTVISSVRQYVVRGVVSYPELEAIYRAVTALVVAHPAEERVRELALKHVLVQWVESRAHVFEASSEPEPIKEEGPLMKALREAIGKDPLPELEALVDTYLQSGAQDPSIAGVVAALSFVNAKTETHRVMGKFKLERAVTQYRRGTTSSAGNDMAIAYCNYLAEYMNSWALLRNVPLDRRGMMLAIVGDYIDGHIIPESDPATHIAAFVVHLIGQRFSSDHLVQYHKPSPPKRERINHALNATLLYWAELPS